MLLQMLHKYNFNWLCDCLLGVHLAVNTRKPEKQHWKGFFSLLEKGIGTKVEAYGVRELLMEGIGILVLTAIRYICHSFLVVAARQTIRGPSRERGLHFLQVESRDCPTLNKQGRKASWWLSHLCSRGVQAP